MRDPTALQRWYLSVIDSMTHSSMVEVASIEGLWWAETDTPKTWQTCGPIFPLNGPRSPLLKQPRQLASRKVVRAGLPEPSTTGGACALVWQVWSDNRIVDGS